MIFLEFIHNIKRNLKPGGSHYDAVESMVQDSSIFSPNLICMSAFGLAYEFDHFTFAICNFVHPMSLSDVTCNR